MLLEIGTEELPAAYLPSLIEQLGRETEALLTAQHLVFATVQSYGTPRRLVLHVTGLAGVQRKPAEEVRGPSKKAAYDEQGTPTKALLGFVASQGGTPAQARIVSNEKGEYVYLTKPETTTPTAALLPQLLPQLIQRLRAPKTMRWDASGVRFARPIRWLLALYGTKPVAATVGVLKSAPKTRTGLPLRMRTHAVTSIPQYFQILKRQGILLDHASRRAFIEQAVAKIASQAGGRPAPEMVQHGLLDEVTFLVEQPTTLIGTFDPKYLSLPREVLLASMAKHQRVFAIEQQGRLLPQCIAILEGAPGKPALVRQVVERILNARLADSLLFWKNDHARLPLEKLAEQLSGVTFHEKLGSMADKSARLQALADPLAEAWGLNQEERAQLRRAALLAKADLVTTMVKEFPTLQGIVGKHYAKDSGAAQAVADAIEEHYLPAAGKSPKTLLGNALAILDKYDTLTGYYGAGIEPTGDQDPFGLRRAAQGIVEAAWNARRPLPLRALGEARLKLPPFAGAPAEASEKSLRRVTEYLLERLFTFTWPGGSQPSADCIQAVLGSRNRDDLVDVMERIQHLAKLQRQPGLLKAAKVIERTGNILKGAKAPDGQVDAATLKEPLEQQLWELFRARHQEVADLTARREYAKATLVFGEVFYAPLHEFFDRVLVNDPDEAIRRNRLALMKAIHSLYTERIADLSKLTILQREAAS